MKVNIIIRCHCHCHCRFDFLFLVCIFVSSLRSGVWCLVVLFSILSANASIHLPSSLLYLESWSASGVLNISFGSSFFFSALPLHCFLRLFQRVNSPFLSLRCLHVIISSLSFARCAASFRLLSGQLCIYPNLPSHPGSAAAASSVLCSALLPPFASSSRLVVLWFGYVR